MKTDPKLSVEQIHQEAKADVAAWLQEGRKSPCPTNRYPALSTAAKLYDEGFRATLATLPEAE